VKTSVGDDGVEEFVDLIGGGEFVHRGSWQLSAISRQLSA
jgi:hypothetical protein